MTARKRGTAASAPAERHPQGEVAAEIAEGRAVEAEAAKLERETEAAAHRKSGARGVAAATKKG